MTVDVRIISVPDFLRIDAAGVLDTEQTRCILREIVSESSRSGVRHILVDVRQVCDGPNVVELFWIVESFAELGFGPDLRLALLYIDRGVGLARFFTDTAQNRGFQIELFERFDEAVAWLNQRAPLTG